MGDVDQWIRKRFPQGNQEILTMVAIVSIRMGDMIIPWSMVYVTDRDEASVLFLH